MERLDAVVVGAGVVGLAVARELALRGRDVVVLEAEDRFGLHASSRNSQVIHAGLYYPTGSIKARTCVEGRELLYRYCADRDIAHRRVGKLLVAVEDAETARLRDYVARARANGVDDLRPLSRPEWESMEPAVRAVAAVFSPASGIIDAQALMLSLSADIEQAGGSIVYRSRVIGGEPRNDHLWLRIAGTPETRALCRTLVNCAGAAAPGLARALGTPERHVPTAYFARGHYFALAGPAPFRHLVYPLPQPGGLGIHVTLDLDGRVRFGPDVHWIDAPDYGFSPDLEPRFRAAIARYFPDIATRRLHPDHSGVRPKIVGPGQADADFVIAGKALHGVPGLVNLFGIESPGLTAALALARLVAERA